MQPVITPAVIPPAEPAPLSPLQLIQADAPAHGYQQWLAGPELGYDAASHCYVISRPALIAEVLQHPACRVRPLDAAVPPALQQRRSGEFFASLMRMNDGVRHQIAKQVSRQCLGPLTEPQVAVACQQALQQLVVSQKVQSAAALNQLLCSYPLYVLANLLGFAPAQQARLVELVRQLMACLSPHSDGTALALADAATAALQQELQALWQAEPAAPLLQQLRAEVANANWQDLTAVLLNLAGWFTQSFDGCRGLLSSALIRLQHQTGWQQRCLQDAGFTQALLREVCRLDAPIQNTRRFTAESIVLAGQPIAAGQTLLLLLAAANLADSPAAQRLQFNPDRPPTRLWNFGHGAHQCPGQQLSLHLSGHALPALLRAGALDQVRHYQFLPSHNARIAEFVCGLSQPQPQPQQPHVFAGVAR